LVGKIETCVSKLSFYRNIVSHVNKALNLYRLSLSFSLQKWFTVESTKKTFSKIDLTAIALSVAGI